MFDPDESSSDISTDIDQDEGFEDSSIDSFIESELGITDIGPEDFEVLTIYEDIELGNDNEIGTDWKVYNETAAENAADETGVSKGYASAVGHNARNDMAADGWLDSDRGVKDYVDYDPNIHGPHEKS